jgi:serine/threonine protein kinase
MTDTVAFLRTVGPFAGLSETRLRALADQCVSRRYEPGARIIARGEPGDAMYIIRDGEVRVPVVDDRGREKFVARLQAGDFFGEMALLTGEPRTADVFAETGAEFLVIEQAPLQGFLGQNPSVAAFLTEILGQRLLQSGQIRQVGKYRLVGEIGRGGVAIVYEGIHPQLQRTVAIKMLSHALVYDQEFSHRFRNEAKIIAGLEHENIVRVYDREEAYATYFIIMEKLSGIDLGRMRETRGAIPEDTVRQILLQLASALDYAHQRGIVHRDIKPENVILNENQQVKLMDFGIAKTRTEEDEGEDIIGTAEYMAPEQVMAGKIDGRTDIYALGVMTYEMLTGTLPFEADDPYDILRMHLEKPLPRLHEQLPGVSPEMTSFVEKAARKRPEDRFRNCIEIIEHFGGRAAMTRPRLHAKTVTFVYDPTEEPAVDAAIRGCTSSVEDKPGVSIKVSDLGPLS